MAITSNNVQNVKFLRNGQIFTGANARSDARAALETNKGLGGDGTAILARYRGTEDTYVKTIVGFIYVSGETKNVTIFDIDDVGSDVQKAIDEINTKIGTGITTDNTATAQLEALSGGTNDTSASTSVKGAKIYASAYTESKISGLDFSGVTTGTGVYVTNVTETDGIVSATTATLPTLAEVHEAGKPIIAVAEDNGQLAASAGTINAEYVNVADSGEKFTASTVENVLAEIDTAYKAADTAIVGGASSSANTLGKLETIVNNISGDAKSYAISAVTGTELTELGTNVKEAYKLVDEDNTQSGTYIKIYKDSSLYRVYLGTTTDTITSPTDPTVIPGSGSEALCFIYQKADGTYELVAVDVESFLQESEFASGVTADSATHVVHGVVDPSSESFLTVGSAGFKISGVSGLVSNAIEGLDAVKSGETTHISVTVGEADGKLTAVTVTETNIANADDLSTLSGKTVTAVAMTGGTANIVDNDSDGTKKITINTDGSQIFMTGYAKGSDSGAVATSDSVNQAIGKLENQIVGKIDALDATVSGETTDGKVNVKVTEANGVITAVDVVGTDIASANDLSTLSGKTVTGVTVNNKAVTVSNNVAPISISATHESGDEANAIKVNTANDGSITISLLGLDAGIYDAE